VAKIKESIEQAKQGNVFTIEELSSILKQALGIPKDKNSNSPAFGQDKLIKKIG